MSEKEKRINRRELETKITPPTEATSEIEESLTETLATKPKKLTQPPTLKKDISLEEDLLKKAGGPPETAPPQPEKHEKAGTAHEHYRTYLEKHYKKPEELKAEIEKNRSKLSKSKTTEIRKNSQLLAESPTNNPVLNLQVETAKRISSYTTKESNDEWYHLNYARMGSDQNGLSHELNIGLGDILLDPEITRILIWPKDQDQPFIAYRGVVKSGKHKGRLAFTTQPGGNGEYVATFTGDKFRILKNNEKVDPKQYIKEEKARQAYEKDYEKFAEFRSRPKNKIRAKVRHGGYKVRINFNNAILNETPSVISDKDAIIRLNGLSPKTGKRRKRRGEYVKEYSDGAEVLAYAKEACKQFDVPWSIFKRTISTESGWNRDVVNNSSGASGLGQFLEKTWKGFIRHTKKEGVHDARWGSKPVTMAHRFNAYTMVYATARLLAESHRPLKIKEKPLSVQGALYYLAHHEGVLGAKHYLRFLDLMRENGKTTKEEIAAEYLANPAEYNKVLYYKQVNRINDGGKGKNIKTFLSIYFRHCKNAAIAAMAESPEALAAERAAIKAGKEEQEHEIPTRTFRGFITKTNKEGETKQIGGYKLRAGQNGWVLGSSSTRGVSRKLQNHVGYFGAEGYSTERILPELFQEAFSHMTDLDIPEKLTTKKILELVQDPEIREKLSNYMPKKVLILGPAINTIASDYSADSTIRQYFQIVEFFEEFGVEVDFATIQPWEFTDKDKNNTIKSFNGLIRGTYSDRNLDLAALYTDENGNWIEGMSDKYRHHPHPKAYRLMADKINEWALK